MSNTKLSGNTINLMVNKANTLATRKVDAAERGFPLTAQEIQDSLASAEDQVLVQDLTARGYAGIITRFLVTEVTLDVCRPVIVQVRSTIPLFSKQGRNVFYTPSQLQNLCCVRAPGKETELSAWVERCVRAHTLRHIVKTTVREVLENWCPSAYHVSTRWPLLGLLAPDKSWQAKLTERPARPKAYGWNTGVLPERLVKGMRATETVLLAAQMMGAQEVDGAAEVRATLEWWGD